MEHPTAMAWRSPHLAAAPPPVARVNVGMVGDIADPRHWPITFGGWARSARLATCNIEG
jgi:hypothetical protein